MATLALNELMLIFSHVLTFTLFGIFATTILEIFFEHLNKKKEFCY